MEDARREFQQGYDRIARIVQAQPNNDLARANLGVMLVRLGEIALDEAGDAALARKEFDRAWKIQEDISQHPRSGNYSETDNHRILSGIAIKQGIALLSLGQPPLARDRFEKALDLRDAWSEAEPKNAAAESYTSEAELWLGVVFSHLGDWRSASKHFAEALQICTELAARYPADVSFKGDIASIKGEQGVAMARLGRLEEAVRVLNESLDYSRAVLARDPENAGQRLVTAADSEWLAALAQKSGKPADAERLWQAALEIRTELAQFENQSAIAQSALCLALAHSGRAEEAMKKAEALSKSSAGRPAVLLGLARCFAACAAVGSKESDPPRAIALAHQAVEAAVRNGYRDAFAIRTDPELAALLSDPSFKKLVDGIKP